MTFSELRNAVIYSIYFLVFVFRSELFRSLFANGPAHWNICLNA